MATDAGAGWNVGQRDGPASTELSGEKAPGEGESGVFFLNANRIFGRRFGLSALGSSGPRPLLRSGECAAVESDGPPVRAAASVDVVMAEVASSSSGASAAAAARAETSDLKRNNWIDRFSATHIFLLHAQKDFFVVAMMTWIFL